MLKGLDEFKDNCERYLDLKNRSDFPDNETSNWEISRDHFFKTSEDLINVLRYNPEKRDLLLQLYNHISEEIYRSMLEHFIKNPKIFDEIHVGKQIITSQITTVEINAKDKVLINKIVNKHIKNILICLNLEEERKVFKEVIKEFMKEIK